MKLDPIAMDKEGEVGGIELKIIKNKTNILSLTDHRTLPTLD